MFRHRQLGARVVLSDLRTGINSGGGPRLSGSTGILLVFSEDRLSSIHADYVPAGSTSNVPADCVSAGHVH
ncbi:hypothetical protein Tco_0433896, partial [Tanacetum coccineum]